MHSFSYPNSVMRLLTAFFRLSVTCCTLGNETQTEWMVLDEICSVPLLIIDDIGKEYAKKANGWSWTQEKTFEIINRRYEDLKPIIFTSNASLEEIAERLDPAIASRIKEMCKGIHCNWEDYRSR